MQFFFFFFCCPVIFLSRVPLGKFKGRGKPMGGGSVTKKCTNMHHISSRPTRCLRLLACDLVSASNQATADDHAGVWIQPCNMLFYGAVLW